MPIPRWISEPARAVRDSAVTAIAAAAGIAVWTAFKLDAAQSGIPLPAAIAAGLLVGAGVIGGWNQLRQLDDRAVRKRLAHRTPADIEKQIWEWARVQQWSVKSETQPDEDFRCRITVETSEVIVLMRKGSAAVIYIGGLNVLEEHKAAALRLQQELAIELLRLGVDYKIEKVNGQITRVVVSHAELFGETITDIQFTKSLSLIERGGKIVAARLQQAVAQEAPKKLNK